MQNHFTSGRKSWRALQQHIAPIIVAGSIAVIGTNAAKAQDASALVDKLVKKGILTDKEGSEVRADMQKEFAQTPAGKLKLSDSISQLKLYGDVTLFWQYNANEKQVNDGSHLNQQSRFRYRLRLNADIELGREWFAGLQLQTGQTPDAAKQTFSNGFNNDNIYISRAYLGWHNDWLKVVAKKENVVLTPGYPFTPVAFLLLIVAMLALLTIHNLHFYLDLMTQVRAHIEAGDYGPWHRAWIERYESDSAV